MKNYKLLITDKLHKIAKEKLTSAGIICEERYNLSEDDLSKIINEYEFILIRTTTKITEKILKNAKKLIAIGTASAGIDHIDTKVAQEFGIEILNATEAHTIAAAEHTIGLIIMAVRNTYEAFNDMKNGIWSRENLLGTELYGKTVGIIGVGRVGTQVAIRLKAFEVKLLGNDLIISKEKTEKIGIEYVSKEFIYKNSDIISLHVPLTELTENLISREQLNMCKDGVVIINAARGKIINESDLVEALNSGKVSRAALDVFSNEPPDFNSPLLKHKNVIMTPHIGAATYEAKIRVADEISEKIIKFVNMKKDIKKFVD